MIIVDNEIITPTAFIRGHLIYYDWGKKRWLYADSDQICDDSRPCKRCGEFPTQEGYDHCWGYIEGAKSACCGHGVEEGFVIAH